MFKKKGKTYKEIKETLCCPDQMITIALKYKKSMKRVSAKY